MTTEVDGLFVCPYNKSHMVDWHKLPNHLVRCRKNNPSLAINMSICPYNQCHHVLKEDLQAHFRDCADYHTFHAITLKPTPHHAQGGRLPNTNTQSNSDLLEQEHLQYNSHRNKFNNTPSSLEKTSSGAAEQHQRNLDDLDEWFVE